VGRELAGSYKGCVPARPLLIAGGNRRSVEVVGYAHPGRTAQIFDCKLVVGDLQLYPSIHLVYLLDRQLAAIDNAIRCSLAQRHKP